MKEKISLKKKEFGKFEYAIENFEADLLVSFPDRPKLALYKPCVALVNRRSAWLKNERLRRKLEQIARR